MQKHYNPTNLGNYDKEKKYTIVSTQWNKEFVNILEMDCKNTLKEKWIKNITSIKVPWSLELIIWAIKAFEAWAEIVIVIWTVIRWETTHYKHVCDWVINWITTLQVHIKKPIIFWLLTCENEKQIKDRLYKWKEWALSAIEMSKLA